MSSGIKRIRRKDLHGPKKETGKERLARERRERDTSGSIHESEKMARYICDALRETNREDISASSEEFISHVLADVAGIELYMHRSGISAKQQLRRSEIANNETVYPYLNPKKEQSRMTSPSKFVCVLCRKEKTSDVHNALPLKEGPCCTDCNITKVIPARIAGRKETS